MTFKGLIGYKIPAYIKSGSLLKNTFLNGLTLLNGVCKPIAKTPSQIKHKRVRIFYEVITKVIYKQTSPIVKARLLSMRDFLVLILDDDYFYRQTFYAAINLFLLELPEYLNDTDDEGWHISKSDIEKIKGIKWG